MNNEEILNMKMLIGHLDLTTDTKNKLYNQATKIEDELNKQKEVLDKIKEYIKLERKVCLGLNNKFGISICDKVNELLEEIE